MVKTKQTPCGGSSSHRHRGMATARFAGAVGDEPQFEDAPGEETEDSQDWPQYGEEKSGASKLTGKAGEQPQQVEGGPEVPPEENPPPPVNPTPGTCKDPTPGTSKDPTDAHQQFPPRTPPRIPLKPKPKK